jgi:aspartyl-tRNA(Asn)/glutamyl-tRNA(Gln) amidotransferase subunit C
MASSDDVKRLAALARIQIEETDLERFSKEFESVLAYVGQIETLEVSAKPDTRPVHRNIFREDGESHEAGIYTEKLAAQFPRREGDALKVKKIISHD